MKEKEWTIMIYMAGDNNLSVDMAYALEQIKGITTQGDERPNLFVYYDGNSPEIPTMYCDFSEADKPRYVRSFKVPDKLYDVPEKHNENAADKRSVLNFVNWCVNQVPVIDENGEITNGRRARKYAMIFSGHSLGFQDIGLFKDETSGKSMKMNDLYFVLQEITSTPEELKADAKKRGFEGEELAVESIPLVGQKLDLLGFDSCVMGMLEVGYQFGYVAKTMVVSEGSVPNAGWTYAKILGCLTSGKDKYDDDRHIAERFVREFVKAQDSYTVGGVSVDMAAWDLGRFDELTSAFDALSVALISCFEDPNSRVYRQMERVVLQVHWKCQSYMYDQNVDLGDFCELLYEECGRVIEDLGQGDDLELLLIVRELCQNVLTELRNAVILSGFSGGAYQYSNGVSVFFPWSREAYEVSKKNYESLFFVTDSENRRFSWQGFLRKYLYEVALRKSDPPTEEVLPGSKYRYLSGIRFEESAYLLPFGGSETEMVKLPGQQSTKLAGQQSTKLAGQQSTKLAGQQSTKLAGQQSTKLAGQQSTKLAGQQSTKLAGQQSTKLAGQQSTKLAGQQSTKMGGGGSDAFFDNLKLFKNIESRWDISGFTKKPEESAPETKSASG